MKSLLDILVDQILSDEKAKTKVKKQLKTTEEEADKANTLEDQLKAEVEKRAKKRLLDALKKSEAQATDLANSEKRAANRRQADVDREKVRQVFVESLQAPTNRLKWECHNGRVEHLRAFLGSEHTFDIKRGVSTFKLYIMSPKLKGKPNLKERANKAGIGNIHSSINVYTLKEKAEKILASIEKKEREQKR